MILQALRDYYVRKAADPESGIAPEGFENKEIPFILVIDKEGTLVNVEDTRQTISNKVRAKAFLVPKGEKRAVNIKPNLLWDNTEYIFGIAVKGKKERVSKQHYSFIEKIKLTGIENDIGISATLKFLSDNPASSLRKFKSSEEILTTNPFMSFRINTDTELVCQRKAILDKISEPEEGNEKAIGRCLISGEFSSLARLQPSIKGVRGTNTTGGDIVSFNLPSFCSFRKLQGENAPISKAVSFAYTTALNHLLGKDSVQKIQVGDASVAFWSDRKSHLEDDFKSFFDEPDKDNPDALTERVSALLKSVDSGVLPIEDNHTRFFILGLSPNAARISVRFWHSGTVTEFAQKIANHFHDLEIIHAPHLRDYLSIWWLLRSLAPQEKSENIPPSLAGDWMRTILNGLPYPETLFQSAIRRIHAERDVGYERAAIIKAFLNRKAKLESQPEKEMTVSLDKDNFNPGYRIGRLFAALEKIQEEASPGINSTIKDRYYSSASGTPASVFPILLRMKNHHAGKLTKGRYIYFEKLLREIMDEIESKGFPPQLTLTDQGRFAIGYYHQRQNFFNKQEKISNN